MIRQAELESKGTRQKVLSYIGMMFRHSLQAPDWYLDTAIAEFLIKYVSTVDIHTRLTALCPGLPR